MSLRFAARPSIHPASQQAFVCVGHGAAKSNKPHSCGDAQAGGGGGEETDSVGHFRTVPGGSQAGRARTAVLELGFDEGVALVREGRNLEEECQRLATLEGSEARSIVTCVGTSVL